ncbi:MAG TPA: FAD-binding oxidoreductase [Acidimicrobiales bacterium]
MVVRRSRWGWGWEDRAMTPRQVDRLGAAVSARFGVPVERVDPCPLEEARLPSSDLEPPASLAHLGRSDPRARATHCYGRSYRDVVRGHQGDFSSAPALVVEPTTEAEVSAVLDWCSTAGRAVVPFGGGSSVVGGVECAGAVSLDLTRLDRVMEIDRTSRAARIQAGTYGPEIEDQLRPHGLTLRHFPQSFECSTLGGWLATRAGGHYATGYTHIDDLVESVRAVTPAGTWESRRLPGSGAGPSPDRMLLGSEGILGVITEAWVRLQDRVRWKASAAAHFPTFAAGVGAVRALAQSGLLPTNCRLLDPGEAATAAGVTDGTAVLVLGFESADHPVDSAMARAVDLVADHGGVVPDGVRSTDHSGTGDRNAGADNARDVDRTDDAVGAWRSAFVRAPYTRDGLVQLGVLVETFETAVTWDRFDALHATVVHAVEAAVAAVCGVGVVTCRFTNAYPDGVAPYFTVMAPARRGSEVQQWDEIKAAASEAVIASGGTITHHHAVGRDHRPWYDRQRPDPFATGLRAAKRALDPAGVLNPGVLIDL